MNKYGKIRKNVETCGKKLGKCGKTWKCVEKMRKMCGKNCGKNMEKCVKSIGNNVENADKMWNMRKYETLRSMQLGVLSLL